MNKRGQLQILMNPKTIAFAIGGALLGYFFFQTFGAAVFGGLIGFAVSFIR